MKKKLLIIGGNSNISKSFQKHFKTKYNIYLTTTKKIPNKKCFQLDLNNDVSIIDFVDSIKKKNLITSLYVQESYMVKKLQITLLKKLINFSI